MSSRHRARLVAAALATATATACVHRVDGPELAHAGDAPEAALGPRFTLLSWNTHKQRERGFEAELRRLAAGVELIALQEVVDPPGPWLALDGGRDWSLVVAFELGRDRVATGVATASTVEPVAEQGLHTPGTEPLTRTPKSMLVSEFALAGGGQRLVLVNLHGINFRPARALAAQLGELDARLDDHHGPLLVVGDFNTWSRARREVVAAFVARHRLASAFAPGQGPRLDAVYLRGLELIEAEIVDARSSDHDALRVSLEVQVPAQRD